MTEEEMEGPISFWGYKEQESNLILPEHDDDDDDESHRLKMQRDLVVVILYGSICIWYLQFYIFTILHWL